MKSMRYIIWPFCLLVIVAVTGTAWHYYGPQPNPDPNHTHADFAVYVSGKRVDFAKDEYMSGLSTGSLDDADHQQHDKYYHLHDGIGTVIHRHKPDLPLSQFFKSIGFTMAEDCFTQPDDQPICNNGSKTWKMYVNGTERPMEPGLVFTDEDKILITYDANQAELQRELAALTDEACRYSQTCRWKGPPPTENCIADPEVPCME